MTITIDSFSLGLGTDFTIEKFGNPLPINVVFKGLPSTNKSQFISNFAKSRKIPINGVIVGDTIADYYAKRELFYSTFYPKQGQLLDIEIVRSDGSYRTITGYLSKIDCDLTTEGISFGDYDIEIFCEDPNYYEVGTQTQTLVANPGGLEFDFEFDADLGNSQGNNLVFTYSGSVAVKPTVTITGPGNMFSITKDGETFTLDVVLFAGQQAIIDVANETVTINGVSYFSYANNFQALIITPGSNTFQFNIFSNSSPSTTLEMSYRNAYLTI